MENLPSDLKKIVRLALSILGEEISLVHGKNFFQLVESLRLKMKDVSKGSESEKLSLYSAELKRIEKLSDVECFNLSHSFGVYLELVNRVESAYRHYRISQKKNVELKKNPYALIYVFTAHPTEARSKKIMDLFFEVEKHLISHFLGDNPTIENDLKFLLNLILRTAISPSKKPTVKDEATHIYNIVLSERNLKLQSELLNKGVTTHFRSWVGGDKDGHPFVNHQTMKDSLQLSRHKILSFIKHNLKEHIRLQKQVDDPNLKLLEEAVSVEDLLGTIKEIEKKDGIRIAKFKKEFKNFLVSFEKEFKHLSPFLITIKNIIWLFPTLVLPLEVREDSELVHQACKDKKMEVYKMLKFLEEISIGERSKWYVRGFVLSMCESADDYLAGLELVKKAMKKLYIPVVPLFETQKALAGATDILGAVFNKDKEILRHHKDAFESRFEVMLGYSDSSKESGVFTGKWLIAKAVHKIDEFLLKNKLTPVFFHGSGGSVARGGGSIKEQIQWWPQSALNIYKVTIQGEMVARNFSNHLILKSQIHKVLSELELVKTQKEPNDLIQAMDKMSVMSKEKYQLLFSDDSFVNMVKKATPYEYLEVLKIGSRPSKRQKTTSNELKLRAIPWVLCWTQTRALLPNWFGIGTAWKNLDKKNKKVIIDNFVKSDYLSSFIKVLGFSLAKIEIEIFEIYLNSFLSTDEAEKMLKVIKDELELTIKFFTEVTNQSKYLYFRPWLSESIDLRSRVIHPINLLQIRALKTNNDKLLRETVSAISCGMMTTG